MCSECGGRPLRSGADYVGKEHGVTGEVCLLPGLSIPSTRTVLTTENWVLTRMDAVGAGEDEECVVVVDEHKHPISGNEKPGVHNKLGLFDLVTRGSVAVTMGLEPEYFRYYRNDREKGPFFAFWRSSAYGVVVEYLR